MVKGKIKQAKSEVKAVSAKTKPQTFGEYMLSWLQSVRTGVEATTYQSYLDAVNARLINYRGYDLVNVRLSDLSGNMF